MKWSVRAWPRWTVIRSLLFPSRSWPSIWVWPLLALFAGVLGWSMLMSHLALEQQRAERSALATAAALARGYAKQTTRTFGTVDLVLKHVRHEWQLSGGTLRLDHLQALGMFPPSTFWNIAVVDASGTVRTSSLPVARGVNVADRPYFRAQQAASDDRLDIGPPLLGRSVNRTNIPFVRRLAGPDGAFQGVVVVGVVPDYFTMFYDATTLGTHGFLGLVGSDGLARVTRIGPRVATGAGPALTAPALTGTRSGGLLTDGPGWFSDGRNRFLAWERSADYPFTVLVGLDQQDTLAPYRIGRDEALHTAMLVGAALAGFTLVATVLSVRLAWRKRQWDSKQLGYRLATEAGNEGFYIARRVLGADGSIVDFTIIDSNRHGAEMLGQRREQLLGMPISQLYRGFRPNRLMAMLRKAMETGLFDSTIEVGTNSPLLARWVHLTMVRTGNGDDVAVTVRDMSATKAHIAELERRGNEDVLTGLPNRHWVHSYLPTMLKRAAERAGPLALLFIDLDGFKVVNDTAGHADGDELLRMAAARIKGAVRPHDHVVRWGGDEFLVIVEQNVQQADAAQAASRIVDAFRDQFRLAKGKFAVGTSIGISLFPDDAGDADTLLRHADVAMYFVKNHGRGGYSFYSQQYYDSLRQRQELANELRHAIELDQFVLYYQPRVDLTAGTTVGWEALVRWQHPQRGLVEPLEFIPLAEETGMVTAIGALVIDKACAQLAAWAAARQPLLPVSINVSARQFNEADVAQVLSAALALHAVAPALVEVELTESSMMTDTPQINDTLSTMRAMGIKLLVDDFGTGYSSLSQLQRLDFDVLKVDRAFTAEIDRSQRGYVLFKTIITMAHALGMKVVAEGVENARQIEILATLECDQLQGFFLSVPLPAADTQPVLARHFLPFADAI